MASIVFRRSRVDRASRSRRVTMSTSPWRGRERAKARGVKMGRKPKLTERQKREAIRRRDHGDETLAEIGRSYNVSGWTISRLT